MDEVRKHNGHDFERLSPRQQAYLELKRTIRDQLDEIRQRQERVAEERQRIHAWVIVGMLFVIVGSFLTLLKIWWP